MPLSRREHAESALLGTLNQFHSHALEVNAKLFPQTEHVLNDYWRLMQQQAFHYAAGLAVRQIKPTNVLQHSLNETNWQDLLAKVSGKKVLLSLSATTSGTYSAFFALPHDALAAKLASMPEEHAQALSIRPLLPASPEIAHSVVSSTNRVALAKFVACVLHPEKKRRK